MTYVKTLIVEDHPFVRQSYKRIISEHSESGLVEHKFEFDFASNCNDFYHLVERKRISHSRIDLVLLDLRIPSYPDKNLVSGEDLGAYLRLNFPNTKIIVITSISSRYRLFNVLKEINPIGLLLKNEMNHIDLVSAVEKALRNEISRSKSVVKMLEQVVVNDDFDALDRKLLYHLSMGETNKDLSKILHLSISGVEKRKRKIAKHLGLETTSTPSIIQEARRKEYI